MDHEKYFDNLDLLLLIVGTLSHDLDHRGLINSYYIKKRHDIAQTVSGQSVLENYHLSQTNKHLDETDLLHALSPGELTRAKKSLTEMIIATDLAKHFKILSDFQSQTGRFDSSNQGQKDFFLGVVVHACDIANSALDFAHFRAWGLRIVQEMDDAFHAEASLPNAAQSPPLPFLQFKDTATFYGSQIGFASMFCAPLLAAMAQEWPELAFLYERTNHNIDVYKQLKEAINK